MHPAFILLLALDTLLITLALTPSWSQDFLPYFTAADLVLSGQADAVTLSPTARHLMDSHPAFIEASIAHTGGAAKATQVTGFLSLPLTLLPVLPLTLLTYAQASTVWRLLIAGLFIGSMHGTDALASHQVPERRVDWALVHFLMLPTYLYGLVLGQTSVLWLAAGIATWLATTRKTPVLIATAAVLVAGLISFKLTPIVLLPALWFASGRRLALGAAALTATAAILSLIAMPVELWQDFFAVASAMSATAMTDWGDLSFEAGLQRLTAGEASPWFAPRPMWITAVSTAWKLGVVLTALAVAYRRPKTGFVAGLSVALTLSPLLWVHYLVLVPALFTSPHLPRWAAPAAAAAVLSVQIPCFLQVDPVWLGTWGTVVATGVVVAALVSCSTSTVGESRIAGS
jgi:hypothetical protein